MREAPRGMYSARLDDRGRLKLPVDFKKYLDIFDDKCFVTSLDRKTARIYPMHLWRENESLFDRYTDDPIVAQNIAFTANELGSEETVDDQGRIPFSPELRKALGVDKAESHEVHIYHHRGRIEVLSQAVFDERKQQAAATAVDDLRKLEGAGLR